MCVCVFFFQAEDGIRDLVRYRGLGDVYKEQVIGTVAGIVVALLGGLFVYGLFSKVTNIRLTEEEEFKGADLSIHSIGSVNHD